MTTKGLLTRERIEGYLEQVHFYGYNGWIPGDEQFVELCRLALAAPSIAGKPNAVPQETRAGEGSVNIRDAGIAEQSLAGAAPIAGKTHKELVERFMAAFQQEAIALVHQKILNRDDCSAIVSAFARIAANEAASALDSAARESEKANEGDSAIVTSERAAAEHPTT